MTQISFQTQRTCTSLLVHWRLHHLPYAVSHSRLFYRPSTPPPSLLPWSCVFGCFLHSHLANYSSIVHTFLAQLCLPWASPFFFFFVSLTTFSILFVLVHSHFSCVASNSTFLSSSIGNSVFSSYLISAR